jgi:radical SAM protein with 4Fe4S-binding SPASM domain
MSENEFVTRRKSSPEPVYQSGRPLLHHLDIELTERCNNNCIHCCINLPAKDQKAARRELGTAAWKEILQQAADLGALTVRFTGGEPLLREDFTEIYRHARKLGMRVMLFTNARLITEELGDLFAKIPPLKKIEISVYGMHERSYDAVARKPGAFREYKQGVDRLLERNIPFIVKSVLLPPNRHELEEFESWADELPSMDRNPSYAVFLDLRGRRDSEARNRLISSLRFAPEEGVELLSRDEEAYRRSMAYFSRDFLYPQGDRLFNCGAGERGCVDAYGNYQMCMTLKHPDTVFDLSNGTLREALTEFFPRVREMKASNPEYLIRCARCFLKGLCEQCPAKSWGEHGTLDTPVEYHCQVAHAQARFLGLIEADEKSWEVSDWKTRIDRFVSETLSVDSIPDSNYAISSCKGEL